jgi:hypothetical protein
LVIVAATISAILLVWALHTTERPGSNPQSPGEPVAGLGATNADWDASHHEVRLDKQGQPYQAGTVYDPQPDGTNRFVAVARTNGRITAFKLVFSSGGTSADAAKDAAYTFVPSDRQLKFDDVHLDCEVLGFQSAVLGAALGAAGRPAYFTIELTSSDPGGPYDASQVRFADVVAGVSIAIMDRSLPCYALESRSWLWDPRMLVSRRAAN